MNSGYQPPTAPANVHSSDDFFFNSAAPHNPDGLTTAFVPSEPYLNRQPNGPFPDWPMPRGPFSDGSLTEQPFFDGPLPSHQLPQFMQPANSVEDDTTPRYGESPMGLNSFSCSLSLSGAPVITNLIHSKNSQWSLLLQNGNFFPPQGPLFFPQQYQQFPFGGPFPFVPYKYTSYNRHHFPFTSNANRFPIVRNRFCVCDSGSNNCMISCHYSPHYKFGYRQ